MWKKMLTFFRYIYLLSINKQVYVSRSFLNKTSTNFVIYFFASSLSISNSGFGAIT